MDHQVVGGGVAREAAVGVALGVGQGDDEAGTVHRVQTGVARQFGRPGQHRRQGRVGGPPVRRVHLGGQGVALGTEPVHGLLCFADQVDEPRCIAAADLTATGDAVGGRQQQTGQQAHDRHPVPPAGPAGPEPAGGHAGHRERPSENSQVMATLR